MPVNIPLPTEGEYMDTIRRHRAGYYMYVCSFLIDKINESTLQEMPRSHSRRLNTRVCVRVCGGTGEGYMSGQNSKDGFSFHYFSLFVLNFSVGEPKQRLDNDCMIFFFVRLVMREHSVSAALRHRM